MHGYGYPPQQPPTSRPSPGTLTTLRAIFVVLTVLSCGFLGWVAMLRLAIVTRKARDWWLLAVTLVLTVGLFAFFAALPEEDEMTDAQALVGVGWLIVLLAGVITYYLIMETRHFAEPGPYGVQRPLAGPTTTTVPYGPATHQHPPAQVRNQAPVQPQHQAQHQHPTPPTTPNPYAVDTPPPIPAPQRLDQVRAELDELSDYLRKENKEGEGR
ncbi:hypothetical protein ACIQVN_25295 [Streptomyces cyaneofuscatus]|uniref:hypothetical protein n=1 Tax=Streptomyces cyaneofuscatus TaxID=66883 RepID=UPI00381DA1BB